MEILNLPKKVKRGEPVKAEAFNALIDALRMSMIQPGKGYLRRVSKSGTSLMIRENVRDGLPGDYAPFAVREVREPTVGNWEIELEPGRVRCANPVQAANGGDGWDYFVPTIGGVPMDQKDVDGDFPKVSVVDGQWIYCKVRRNAEGMVTETPEIEAGAAGLDSDHYQPPDPDDSGTEEVFQYVRILEFADVDDAAEIRHWRKSDIDLVGQLWAGENIGTGGEHFKEHEETEGRWKFRNTHGRFGTEAATNGDSVDVDFDGENLENLTGGSTGEVYKEPTPAEITAGGKAEFRPITQGPSGRREITVDQSGDVVRVYGNDVTGPLDLTINGTTITVAECVDGLWTLRDGGSWTIDALPSGNRGDMIYHNGVGWVALANPGVPANEGWVLVHAGAGGDPYWLDTTVTL